MRNNDGGTNFFKGGKLKRRTEGIREYEIFDVGNFNSD